MSEKKKPAASPFWIKVLAFCLVMFPPIGLYFSVTLGAAWATWLLMGLITIGMLLTMRYT